MKIGSYKFKLLLTGISFTVVGVFLLIGSFFVYVKIDFEGMLLGIIFTITGSVSLYLSKKMKNS